MRLSQAKVGKTYIAYYEDNQYTLELVSIIEVDGQKIYVMVKHRVYADDILEGGCIIPFNEDGTGKMMPFDEEDIWISRGASAKPKYTVKKDPHRSGGLE